MKKIKILQVGLGPLGIMIAKYIDEKESLETIAALDVSIALKDKDLGLLSVGERSGVKIVQDVVQIDSVSEVDVIILTTSSSLLKIESQLQKLLPLKKPIISTCEELTFPWTSNEELSKKIDAAAKENEVAVLSTGVNPGFLMDTLPSMLTAVSKTVDFVQVNRFQDAKSRRLPFQKKIGAGLSLTEFEEKKQSGTLRHVGLTESMHFIAHALKWQLDYTEDVLSPIIAKKEIQTENLIIKKGETMGVKQIGIAKYKGEEKIRLEFQAAVGLDESFDEVKISGIPNLHSRIEGGVHGDVATCSIVLNSIRNVMNTSPGLKTMKDISLVSYTP